MIDRITKKSKDYNQMSNDHVLPNNIKYSRTDFIKGITFKIRFVGRLEIDRPTNKDEIIAAMRRVRQEYKLRSFKKRSASLSISIDGITVDLMKKKIVPKSSDVPEISWHHPINKVFYVSHDSRDLKVFSYIARDVPSNQFVCIVFKTSKEIATNIVSTIGKAFEVVHLINSTKSDPTSPQVARAASPTYTENNDSTNVEHQEEMHEHGAEGCYAGQMGMTRSYSSTGITTDLLHPLEIPMKIEDEQFEHKFESAYTLNEEQALCIDQTTSSEAPNCFQTASSIQEPLVCIDKRPMCNDNYIREEDEECYDDFYDHSSETIIKESDNRKVEISERDLRMLKGQLIQLTKMLNFERKTNHFTEIRLEKVCNEFYLMRDQFSRIVHRLSNKGLIDDILEENSDPSNCCMCKSFLAHCMKNQCPHKQMTNKNRSATLYDFQKKQLNKMPRAETFNTGLKDLCSNMQLQQRPSSKAYHIQMHSKNPKIFKNASLDYSLTHASDMAQRKNLSCYKISQSSRGHSDDIEQGQEELIKFSPCKKSTTMFEMSNLTPFDENKALVTSKSQDFTLMNETNPQKEEETINNPLFELLNELKPKNKVIESKSDFSISIKPLPPPSDDTESNKKRIKKAQTFTESTMSIPRLKSGQEYLDTLDKLLLSSPFSNQSQL